MAQMTDRVPVGSPMQRRLIINSKKQFNYKRAFDLDPLAFAGAGPGYQDQINSLNDEVKKKDEEIQTLKAKFEAQEDQVKQLEQ